MATSPWFDYNVYMANKLIQVQKADSAANWDMAQVVQAFADAGFIGAEGAEAHFKAHGQYEDVAPNAFFNATEYYKAKAASFYKKEDPKAVTDLEAASIQVAIKDAGMSAWSHYAKYGNTEKVNPSNSFDTEAYMNAKLVALNNIPDGKEYILAEVYEAFQAAGLSALEHFMLYGGKGEGEVTQKYDPAKPAIPAEFAVPEDKKVTSGGGSDGETFTLTTGIDIVPGTSGDDTIVGDANTTQAADQVDGGAGENVFQFYGANTAAASLILPNMQNVASLELINNDSTAIDISGMADLKSITLNKHDLATNDVTLTLAGQSVSIKAPTVAATGGDTITIASTDDTLLNIAVDSFAKPATSGVTTMDIAGTKMATMNLTASGKDSAFTLTNTGTALNTLNIDGKGKVAIAETLTTLTTINAAKNSGGVDIDLTGIASDHNLTFTGGSGNDRLHMGDIAHLTAGDKIDFGAGDADTLGLNAATVNAAQAKLINAATGIDILEIKGGALGAGTGAAIDADLFTFNTFKISTAATGVAGVTSGTPIVATAGAAFTGIASDSSDTIILAANLTGGIGASGTTPQHAAAGLALKVKNNSNTDAVNIHIVDANVTLTGGASASGTDAANAGVGLDARDFEVLNITVAKDLTITAGSTPAATETDTLVATFAKVNVSGKGDVDLGTVADGNGADSTSNNLTIDAHSLEGELTVITGAGRDTILAGSKGSDITAGIGGDTITCGAGVDILKMVAGDSGTVDGGTSKIAAGSYDVISGFTAAIGGDVLKGLSADYEALTADELATVAKAADLTAAADAALAAASNSKWTAFKYADKTYAIYDTDDTFDATAGVIVELVGVDVANLDAANFAA